jgi:ankyrin repeat protein
LIIDNLLQYGFTVTPEDVNNCELLHAAVEKGYLKVVEEFLKYGIDVNMLYKRKYRSYTLLHVATKTKQEEVAKLLISYGADVNAQDKTGKTAIFYAAENADLKIAKLLLNNKANIQDYPEILYDAVMKGCRKIVKVLLQHGADVNTRDEGGRTALHFSARGEDIGFHGGEYVDDNVKGEIAKLLVSVGADVNAESDTGITALHIAAEQGWVKLIEAILECNADVNCKTDIDTTPLHIAAEDGYPECVEFLLQVGASVDSRDKCG